MKTQFTTVAEAVSTKPESKPAIKIRLELPGRVVNVDNDGRGVIMEVFGNGRPLINTDAFDQVTAGMAIEDREELYSKLTHSAMIAIIRATIVIR